MKSKYLLLFALAAITALSSCKKDDIEEFIAATYTAGQFTVNDCSEMSTLSSTLFTPSTNIYFKNESGETLKVYWIDSNGILVLYHGNLASNTGQLQQTFLTHPWYITNASEECVTIVTALEPFTTDTVTFVKQAQ